MFATAGALLDDNPVVRSVFRHEIMKHNNDNHNPLPLDPYYKIINVSSDVNVSKTREHPM